MSIGHYLSAANDFWGKTFLSMGGGATMTQSLSIATGCAAGATESFVVSPRWDSDFSASITSGAS